jgi:subtilisin family serine protease
MRSPRRREPNQVGPLSIVALAATVLVVIAGGAQYAGSSAFRTSGTSWRGLVGENRADLALGQRQIVLLKAPSLAERVLAAGGHAGDAQERRWTIEAKDAQKSLFDRLALQGIVVRPDYSFTRVVNGFAAAIDPRVIPVLERAPEVEAVYPVRGAYPASVSTSLRRGLFGPGSGHRTDVTLPGYDGRGVTVALLDSGVDRSHPYLRGRVRSGVDVVAHDQSALAEAAPDDPARLETHGTQMAGLVVGAGGPAGLSGVAPGANLLPIRVAGWQQDATGRWAVYARTDQLIAGLERAVDPNGDGLAHDAARIALVSLSVPFASFADSPVARAVDGALALDTLVVAAVGNDGPAGPAYGSVSGPAGARGALAVGAVDARQESDEVRVVVRAGLDVAFAGVVPLVNAVTPAGAVTLQPGAPVERAQHAGVAERAPELADFFDATGYSLVAGRAAIVRAGNEPAQAAERAAEAGAAAILLYGGSLPAGALGLREEIAVPVVAIPDNAARAALAALARGADAGVSIGRARTSSNAGADRVAQFSSRGLAYDGRVKPDVVASGVGLASADAGANDDGSPRYGTVNGSSAAAATVAGAAALLAQARPALDALALRSLLAGAARPIGDESVLAQGAGLVDLGAAVATEFAADETTLAFGHLQMAGAARVRRVTVRNLSPRTLRIDTSLSVRGTGADVRVQPASLVVGAGRSAHVEVSVSAKRLPASPAAVEGVLQLTPDGGRPLRIPWAVVLGRPTRELIGDAQLSAPSFAPSDGAPVVLSLQAGRVEERAGRQRVYALSRLRVDVWTVGPDGRNLGALASLRDVLPGRYAFGLTGRGPAGAILKPGRYRLQIVATPTEPGPPSIRSLPITIE